MSRGLYDPTDPELIAARATLAQERRKFADAWGELKTVKRAYTRQGRHLAALTEALRDVVKKMAIARDSVPTGLPWIYHPCQQNNPDCPSSACQAGYALQRAERLLGAQPAEGVGA